MCAEVLTSFTFARNNNNESRVTFRANLQVGDLLRKVYLGAMNSKALSARSVIVASGGECL